MNQEEAAREKARLGEPNNVCLWGKEKLAEGYRKERLPRKSLGLQKGLMNICFHRTACF